MSVLCTRALVPPFGLSWDRKKKTSSNSREGPWHTATAKETGAELPGMVHETWSSASCLSEPNVKCHGVR